MGWGGDNVSTIISGVTIHNADITLVCICFIGLHLRRENVRG